MKKTLFIDMDEVMADTFSKHVELYNQDFNEQLRHEDCIGNDIWNVVPEQRKKSIIAHVYKKGFFRDLRPIKDSQEVIRALYDAYEVYVASAAMQFPNSLLEKNEWLDEHFSFIHWRRRILCGDKFILKGSYLIDDRSYNLENFDGTGLLFSSPHNYHENGFKRVDTWQDVANLLL